jgi:hypothetical protein
LEQIPSVRDDNIIGLTYSILSNIALSLEEIDEVTHIFCFDESYEFAIFGHRHESISFDDAEHITDIFGDDDLSLGTDCH